MMHMVYFFSFADGSSGAATLLQWHHGFGAAGPESKAGMEAVQLGASADGDLLESVGPPGRGLIEIGT